MNGELTPIEPRATTGRPLSCFVQPASVRSSPAKAGSQYRRVETWNAQVERWLVATGAIPGTWYPGRPVLVTANDPSLRLYNGDAGVVVARGDEPAAVAFAHDGGLMHVAPVRLGAIAPAHAMTIHKSQGSQFTTVAVLLPPASSPLLTRELLYTAITRARARLIVVGEAASVGAAVARPVARASGLESALWGPRPARTP